MSKYWNTDEAVALRTYFREHPVFIQALELAKPKIKADTIEQAAMTGQAKEGFELCMAEINKLHDYHGKGQEAPPFIEEKKPAEDK